MGGPDRTFNAYRSTSSLVPSGENRGWLSVKSASPPKVTVRSDAAFREHVIFAPRHSEVVCLEPYTCTTDAFNLAGNGLLPIYLSAQFIALSMKVTGGATVNLVPNPYDSIPTVIYNVLLVR